MTNLTTTAGTIFSWVSILGGILLYALSITSSPIAWNNDADFFTTDGNRGTDCIGERGAPVTLCSHPAPTATQNSARILPDAQLTPGAIDPRVTQANIQTTICQPGYARSVRPPARVMATLKQQIMRAYGYTDSPTNYELDHLIPLELGGCPRCVANLWPEPWMGPWGAHTKDSVENTLHRQVCRGTLTLHNVQETIARDWVHALPPQETTP